MSLYVHLLEQEDSLEVVAVYEDKQKIIQHRK